MNKMNCTIGREKQLPAGRVVPLPQAPSLYAVDLNGRGVWSYTTGRWLKARWHRGHAEVRVSVPDRPGGKRHRVWCPLARIVYATGHSEPWHASFDVDHADGDPRNNRLENLRLRTRRLNRASRQRPTPPDTSTLGFRQLVQLIHLLDEIDPRDGTALSLTTIAGHLGTSPRHLRRILSGAQRADDLRLAKAYVASAGACFD